MVDKPRLAACIAGRIHGFLVPLYQPLRVGEAAFLFRMACSRQQENLSADFFGAKLTALDFWGVIPERCCFHLYQVAYDQPLQLSERLALQS